MAPLRARIEAINRDVPLYETRKYEEMLSNASAQPRFQMLLLTGFAGMALLLAAIGPYSVLAYMVAQRSTEMGLRIALGAQRGDVLALTLKQGLRPATIGLVAGVAASALLTRYVSTLLFGVRAFDPLTYLCVSALLALIALIASAGPALQASRVDPIRTLREQQTTREASHRTSRPVLCHSPTEIPFPACNELITKFLKLGKRGADMELGEGLEREIACVHPSRRGPMGPT